MQKLDGYPHKYWLPAEKEGYSGVAILSKKEPINVKVIGHDVAFIAKFIHQLIKLDLPRTSRRRYFKSNQSSLNAENENIITHQDNFRVNFKYLAISNRLTNQWASN